ncbi:group III truncated hemoglobin [Luteolibacter marinus]|uniref:group III truncated hemoglobin n=1 Tax=Luteolibacter marinus TaxID=2776705 RepID=UPI0018682BF9|nr:group III truncated hemoglobin [Luteolibacter marinus]
MEESIADIQGRDEIVRLVNAFYGKVRRDELLGFIFDEVAAIDWEIHLPKMYAFWQTVLFRDGGFRGDPIGKHARLVPLTAMGRDQFDRWLKLFRETVDELFSGENAEHIKRCAEDMANVIHSKINAISDERLDSARLTPEQRARYAAYREQAGH